ncbi:MAG: protein kinase [Acidobacteriota bacterium]|nr:protein kinase [Acidobacteriota bacterium]
MKLEKDTTISQYRILSEIGKGGMGEVYLAQDTKLNRQVAIKFLSDEFSKDSDKLNRFVQEAQSASALNHPNIITVFEIGETDNLQYIALEYIEGETLSKRLRKKLKFNTALDIATQIASALDAAHSAGIVHRDIKPDNVMVREDGLVKILDFGIAKLTEKSTPEIESEDKTAVQVNTTPGMIIGTANYMSPEQAKGKEVDARTDIFSFGVVLYEMISGRLPFEGESPLEIIGSILNKEPKPIDNAEVPAEVERIISKTLRKDRNERYQTIKDLLIDLRDAKEDLKFQDKLDKTIQPNRDEPDTQVFRATTAAEAQNTTASGINDSITIKKSGLGKAVIGILAILLVSAIGVGYWFFSSGNQINSIAVMPFVNETGDNDVEYLSDGMTETLISSLTKIPGLSVMARSSVFYYKGKNTNPRQIGEELNVEAILLGRVTQRGEDLKLSLELVDTKTLAAIWSETYDRKMNDLVSLQSEIARDVSDKLRLKLTATDQEKVAKTDTTNSEAQQFYLKGRFYWNKRSVEGFEKAEDFFKHAIEKDPTYALAYSGLADTYSLKPYYGNFRPREYFPKAKQAALKALELGPTLAEAYASLGQLLSFQYDFDGADRALKKAIELNPNYATAHQWYAENLMYLGKTEESLKEMDIALKLDPLSPIINHGKSYVLECADRYDEAIAQAEKTIELFPELEKTRGNLSRQYFAKGNYDKAAEPIFVQLKLLNVDPEDIRTFKAAYENDGWKGFWNARLEDELNKRKKILQKDKTAYTEFLTLAYVYAALGEKDKTLEYLNKAYEQREPGLVDIRTIYYYDFLKDEPEFKGLVKKVGFPE